MIVRTVKARSLRANRRLDPKYFLSPGTQAAERLSLAGAGGAELRPIGGLDGLGHAWMPGRARKCYAVQGEESVPYLRAYDVFEYVPRPADMLSLTRSDQLDELFVPSGTILQTRSGRNLGPAVMADRHLAEFAVSDDLVRVEIPDETSRSYLLAFLSTPTGQALLRRDKTGSVIDHLSVGHVERLLVPFFDEETTKATSMHMAQSIRLREEARATLSSAIGALSSRLPSTERSHPMARGWTVGARTMRSRVDAAFHDPLVARLRSDLLHMGGQSLREVAEVRKPSGRYKTFYVHEAHGRPILSGRQLLQYWPINLQHISARSLDPSRYELPKRAIAFQADGRAEEKLGAPVMIEPARDGWLASGHIGRLIAREGIEPGWLFAAFATEQVQIQVKALACGSVVDALYVDALENVVLPPVREGDHVSVERAWEQFSDAADAQAKAVGLVESGLSELTGEQQLSA